YSPGGALNALASAQEGLIPPTPSAHRLQLGLPGYLIPFAPLAFAPQRQCRSRKPPSPPVFLRISTHFTATPGIPLPSPQLKPYILHAALLRQACAHCEKFPTAASRRSLGRVSVPVWPSALSGRLPIEALVGHYPANKLIGRGLLSKRQALRSPALIVRPFDP